MSDEPKLINSDLSRSMTWEGCRQQVEIYRLDDRPNWTLEVVNEAGTSTVWDDLSDTDRDADAAFQTALLTEGMAAFLEGYYVRAFPARRH